MSEDVRVAREIRELTRRKLGAIPPTVIVMTQADLLKPAREWPPSHSKLSSIQAVLDYVTKDVLGIRTYQPLDPQEPAFGYKVTDDHVRGVIPVASPPGEPFWNVELLSTCVGELIPKEAQLDFFQAQQRRALLKTAATDLVNRYSAIAGLVGASPIPLSDMAILTPLQMLMIATVGGLSCRSFSIETSGEFLAAAGVTAATGFAMREVARQLLKFIPIAGSVVSGGIAASGTRALGQSAVTYFFRGELRKPEEFLTQ
jgi:uncharacterized protein (DUF697 family)